MEESFSTVIPVSAVKPVSLQPWNSSPGHEDLYCMNRPPRSDLSSTYDINSSTSQAKSDHCINSDLVWLPEVSSSDINENHEGFDLNLTLDLALRVNQADGNRIAPQPSPPIAGGMEQETIVAARDFQLQTVNRRENNNDIYSVSRDMVNAEFGFERNCHEAIVGQARTVQCSASVTSKENQQEILMINLNEAKHLAISSNISRQTRSFGTNHSGMTLLDGFCNLSQDKVLQLSNFDPNLTDNHFTDADHCSNSTIEDRVRCWSPIRANQRNSLCPFPNPSGENQQGAMAGRFVQGHGNSLYVKVNMDGMPIGRKLDLNAYESYETLAQDLKNMFQLTTEDYIEACLPMAKNPAVKPLTLLDPTADFVLTYEDNEGDCMFVGDVPWKMFLRTVKRLRILKSSGSNAFAKKCSKKGKAI